jgi:transcriptional regulator GlxA family with amidase domain
MYTVALLAVDNCMYSSLTGPFDLLTVASVEARRLGLTEDSRPLFSPVVVGPPDRPVVAFNESPVVTHATFDDVTLYDIVVVPVIFGEISIAIADRPTVDWLTAQGRRGACLTSVCAGAFLLAQTGLLAGRRATTHWNLADEFAHRFPQVRLKREKMIVDEGDCITAGGVSAYLDLSLYLVARFGSPELAASLSKLLLIDPARRQQTPYCSRRLNKSHGDPQILAVQDWLDEHVAEPVAVADMAAQARLGERTFMRRFKKATGDTPLEYLQHLRIETARRFLETTAEPVEAITPLAGYSDASSFRKLFKRVTGLSPGAYRKKFSLIG